MGGTLELQQQVSSSVDPRIVAGLEKVYSGAGGFDLNLTVDQNLRVNRIHSELVPMKDRLGWSDGFVQLELLPEIRQAVKHDYGDNALVVTSCYVRIETDRLCGPIVLHNQPLARRVSRMILYVGAKQLASYRLRKKVIMLSSREGLPILDVEPSKRQIDGACRQINDLILVWGGEKPWLKRNRRNKRNRR